VIRKGLLIILTGAIIAAGWIQSAHAALNYEEVYTSSSGTNEVLIVVESDIYDAISVSLGQYIADLENEDYFLRVTKIISGTPEELKAYIITFANLKGALFIGDLPTPYYEFANDFNKYGYRYFPTDLFYMDQDGTWTDGDTNNRYDTHEAGGGTLGPEIWLARLKSSNLSHVTMDEIDLINNYFDKAHKYRTEGMPVKHRALGYPEDDWYYWKTCYLEKAYSDVTAVWEKADTNAADYKNRLAQSYEFIHVCVHSCATYHAFTGGTVNYAYIRDNDPLTLFYNLFACSNCKYTSSNYMGGHYIFSQTYGLGAVGSTKTGSMLNFSYYYTPMGPGFRKNMGESYKDWFNNMNLSSMSYKYWFYGMTLLGDPTLSLDPPRAYIDSIVPASSASGETVSFTGSGLTHEGRAMTAFSWRSDVDGVLSDQSSFSTTSLSDGTHEIYFKVKDDKNRWSAEASVTITIGSGAAVPTTPVVTDEGASVIRSDQLAASWTSDGQGTTITEYKYRITEGSATGKVIRPWTSTGTKPSVTADELDLTGYRTYYFGVKVKNDLELWSDIGYSDGIVIYVPPRPPENLSASALLQDSIRLNWTDKAESEDGFIIERSPDGTNFTQIHDTGASNISTYTDTGLTPDTTYYYRVCAYNASGNSAYSNSVSAKTYPLPPDPPSNMTANEVSSYQVDLTWTDNSDNEIYFYVERSADNIVFEIIRYASSNETSYSDNALLDDRNRIEPDTTYYYRARAYNAGGYSGYSNTANATTSPATINAPSNLLAVLTASRKVDLTWQDNSNNEEGFTIEKRYNYGGGSFSVWFTAGSVSSDIQSFSDTGVFPGQSYQYRVVATSSSEGYSDISNVIDVTTPIDLGSVSGTVSDEDTGGVLQNMVVKAYDWSSKKLIGQGASLSDGTYVIDNLPAGSYRIKAESSDGSYGYKYYDNVEEESLASQVSVTVNKETSGINFNLPSLENIGVDIYLDYNQVGYSVKPQGLPDPYKASDFINDMACCSININTVMQWDGAAWISHQNGLTFTDFDIDMDKGIFINASYGDAPPVTWNMIGEKIILPKPVTLYSGWNLVAIPSKANVTTTLEVLEQINGQGGTADVIMWWDGAIWISTQAGLPFTSRDLVKGRSYFIRCSAGSVWHIQK